MASDAERLLAGIAIESYIQKFVPLKRKGANLWGICPFHSENTPSFSVSPERGIYKCFGCGAGGNLITFVKEYEKVSFPEALRILSESSGIPLERGVSESHRKDQDSRDAAYRLNDWFAQRFHQLRSDARAAAYLHSRGLTPQVIEHLRIGYHPASYSWIESEIRSHFAGSAENTIALASDLGLIGRGESGAYNRFRDRIMFPIRDSRGNTSGFGGRILENRDNTAKYMNSPDSPVFNKRANLYHLYEAREDIRKAGQAIIVEGYLDVAGLWMAGFPNVVAPLGTAFTPEQAQLLKRYTDRVILFPDTDTAGIEAAFKSVQIARRAALDARVVVYAPALSSGSKSDPFDLSGQMSQTDLALLLDSARAEVPFTLWYFFQWKYQVSELAGKRKAIAAFREFLQEDAQRPEWERAELRREAAVFLGIPEGELTPAIVTTKLQPGKKPVSAPPAVAGYEMDIIALVLAHPDLFAETGLLDLAYFPDDNSELLFSTFRDWLAAGEAWRWEDLGKVMHRLPAELASLLGTLIMQRPVHQDLPRSRNLLQRAVYDSKIHQLESEIRDKQKELQQAEQLGDPEADRITADLTAAIRDREHFQSLLSRIPS